MEESEKLSFEWVTMYSFMCVISSLELIISAGFILSISNERFALGIAMIAIILLLLVSLELFFAAIGALFFGASNLKGQKLAVLGCFIVGV